MKSEPVGASLSAQTPPKLIAKLRELAGRITPGPWRIDPIRLTVNDRCAPWIEAESEPYDCMGYRGLRTVARIEGSTLGDKEANAELISLAPTLLKLVLSGAAQEGDCPCGATVVRKSDSANKSKLCADCAAQEEAPSPWKSMSESPKSVGDYLVALKTPRADSLNFFIVSLASYLGDAGWSKAAEGANLWMEIPEPRERTVMPIETTGRTTATTTIDKTGDASVKTRGVVAEEEAPQVDTVEYWKSRATTAELKVLTFHEEIVKLRKSPQWAVFYRCGKNMGNDLLVIPCDLEKDHEGPCERNVWPVGAPEPQEPK